MHKKRPITLLETLISFALASIVLMALLGTYHSIEYLHSKQKQLEEEITTDLFLQHRLEDLFYQIPTAPLPQYPPIFATENLSIPPLAKGPSLVFSHYTDGSAYAEINHIAISRLILDEKGNLSLITWPYPKEYVEDPSYAHQEILAPNVQYLSFFFYIPPKENLPISSSTELSPDTWHSHWPKDTKYLPAILAIEITRNDQKKLFAYPITQKEQFPKYNLTKPIEIS